MVMRKDNQMLKRVNLAGRIDRSANADEADTMQTKRALRALGYYSTPAYGMTPYPDEPMFEGIKSYQRANKLKIDGVMKPGGETERSMNQRLTSGTGNDGQRPKFPHTNTPVIRPPRVDPNMPVLKDPFLPNPGPKDDIYTDPFVDEHGNPVIDGENPKNGKHVRPPKRT